MLAFICGAFIGTCAGFLIAGLLTIPHIAELESTIFGLRELLVFYGICNEKDEEKYQN